MKKAINTFYVLFLLPLTLMAQGWEKIYEEIHDETFYSASLSPDGGVVLGGVKDFPTDSSVAFVHRTNADGEIQWTYYDSSVVSFVRMDGVIAATDGSVLFSSVASSVTPSFSPMQLNKLDPAGQLLWSTSIPRADLAYARRILEDAHGNFILIGSTELSAVGGVVKIDADGNTIWTSPITVPGDLPIYPAGGLETSGGDIFVAGYTGYFSDDQNVVLTKLDDAGTIVWQKIYPAANAQFGLDIIETPQGEFVIAVSTADVISGDNEAGLLSVDQDGDQLNWTPVPGFDSSISGYLGLKTTSYGMAMAGTTLNGSQENDFRLTLLNSNGGVIDSKTFGRSQRERLNELVPAGNDGFFLAGYTRRLDGSRDGYLVKADSLGDSFSNTIEGKIFFDEDLSCSLDSVEIGLENWILKVENNGFEWLANTDQDGNYSFNVDTGTYELIAFPISPYWELCQDTLTVTFTDFYESDTIDFPAQALVDCSYLEVSVSTPFLRRCFENTYYLNYCNLGTDLAEDAYVEFTLDPSMFYLNSSIPFSSQNGPTYTFEVGDLEIGECGSFTIDIELACDSVLLGATHCVEAHIYPDSICVPAPPNWSGASIEVDATCDGDSVIFFIENVGFAPTSTPINYIVIEDDVILFQGGIDLMMGEIQRLPFAANGATYRLESDQEMGHPGNSSPSVWVEGCAEGNDPISLGYVTLFPQNDADPFVDIDCQENIGAYDPNDKAGYPKGFSSDHIIHQNQDLEYLIRFQNTGTDTAFNVVIRDTLSAFLNSSAIRIGAASHPYEFSISGSGALEFHFPNIMLPDSNINEPASHGFIRFRIAQQRDLPFGTVIANQAGIYFDFNAPVITNQTIHTIGELSTTVNVENVWKEGVDIEVYPNPFIHSATLEIKGMETIEKGMLRIHDSQGRLVQSQTFAGKNITLNRSNLAAGIYFFQVSAEGQSLGSGKILIQ